MSSGIDASNPPPEDPEKRAAAMKVMAKKGDMVKEGPLFGQEVHQAVRRTSLPQKGFKHSKTKDLLSRQILAQVCSCISGKKLVIAFNE